MNGMEMAMTSVFKWLKLDPQETVQMFFGARDAAYAARDATARIEAGQLRIEAALAENRAMLAALTALLTANNEAPNEQSPGHRAESGRNGGGQ
jgi:hypothetical protein